MDNGNARMQNWNLLKSKSVFIALPILVVVLVLGIVLFPDAPEDYTAFIAIGCDGTLYEQEADIGYLTIDYNQKNITVQVEDQDLQNSLAGKRAEDIIGVNMQLTIPLEVLKERHLDLKNVDALQLLLYEEYEQYLLLQDVFYKDVRDTDRP